MALASVMASTTGASNLYVSAQVQVGSRLLVHAKRPGLKNAIKQGQGQTLHQPSLRIGDVGKYDAR